MISKRPNIPSPEPDIKFYTIPGRSGSLTVDEATFSDIEIKIEMNFIVRPEEWGKKFRDIKKWILSGKGTLVFMDDVEVFYKVKKACISENERKIRSSGEFTVSFTCDPFTYYEEGKHEFLFAKKIYNPGYKSKPIYRISGEGLCNLTVNEKKFTVNVGQKVTIDTERMITYRNDGVISNADASGEYEDLYLEEGENEINITEGFDCKIIPNWRML